MIVIFGVLYLIGLMYAGVVHATEVKEDGLPSRPVRWVWTFLTIFWPLALIYFLYKYLFYE